MPANTAKGYPYPVGTDRVMDGDNDIRALAEAVDTKVGLACSGKVTPPVPGALNTPVSVAVTFPAGLFSVAPIVVANPDTNSPHLTVGSASGATATGCLVWYAKTSGGLVSVPVNWVARQG